MQQDPVQEPRQSLNATLEAMKVNAIASNERIFPIFAQKLSSGDAKEFANTARKFAVWLSSEKAYYAVALPKIVDLLEITVSTFTNTFFHHPAVTELAGYMRHLIEVVTPFRKLFGETELQSRLQRVLSDAKSALYKISVGTTPAMDEGFVPTNAPSHTLPATSPTRDFLQPQPSSPMLSVVKRDPDGFVVPAQANGPLETVSPNQPPSIPLLASPVTSTPVDSVENASPTILSRPQPKRARRAIELSDELIARDFDWFKSTQGPTTANREHGTPTGESGPASVPSVTRSPSPKKKTARMVPSRRFPRRVSLSDDVQETDPSAVPPALKRANDDPGQDISTNVGMDEQQPTGSEESPLPEPQPVAPSPGPLHETRTSPVDCKSAIEPTDREVSVSAACPESVKRMASVDVNTSQVVAESPTPTAGSASPQSVAFEFQKPVLPPLVNSLVPPLDLNFNARQPRQPTIDADQERFDGRMAVIYSTQGKSFTHTHIIEIVLSESIYCKISKWVKRRSRPSDASRGVCISLGCYRLPTTLVNGQVSTSQMQCSWPPSNRLSLHVKDAKRHTIVTLAPPYFLTPDRCVDVSSLLKPGNNSLEVVQKDDLSEYLFVLHAHHPTRAQLAEVDAVKTGDERWRRFLDVVAARVPVDPEGTRSGDV